MSNDVTLLSADKWSEEFKLEVVANDNIGMVSEALIVVIALLVVIVFIVVLVSIVDFVIAFCVSAIDGWVLPVVAAVAPAAAVFVVVIGIVVVVILVVVIVVVVVCVVVVVIVVVVVVGVVVVVVGVGVGVLVVVVVIVVVLFSMFLSLQQICLKLLFSQSIKSQNFGSFLVFFSRSLLFTKLLTLPLSKVDRFVEVLNGC